MRALAATGGGAYVTGATGEVTIREIRPALVAGAGRLIVSAQEDQAGNPDIWAATAYAVCAI